MESHFGLTENEAMGTAGRMLAKLKKARLSCLAGSSGLFTKAPMPSLLLRFKSSQQQQ